MNKTKIAFMLYDFLRGGITTSYINLCNELRDKYNFFFLASDCREFHPEIERLGKCIYTGPDISKIRSWLEKIKPDIAQIACKNEYLIACENVGIQNIIERVGGIRAILRLPKDRLSAAVCHAQGAKNIVDKLMPPEKVYLIRNGVFLPHESDVKKHTEKLIYPEEPSLIIGRMTRLGRGQNLDLILTVAEIMSRHTFLIAGSNSPLSRADDELGYLSKEINIRGINNIWLYGEVWGKEKEDLMKIIDIAVCTSREEGISNFLIEAMSYGLPVISTDVGFHRELGDINFIKPNDVNALIYNIKLLEHAYRRNEQGARNRKLIEEHWNIKKTAEQYHNLYQKIINE